jgi:hypothetical protein
MKTTFQQWVDDNNVVDVQFYPKNISATSATEIVDDANEMINAYIEGKTSKFIDPLEREANR